jgi:hypothetical protein
MAILSSSALGGPSRRRTLRRWAACLGALALLLVAGCLLKEAPEAVEQPLAFPHRVHIEDEGLDCSDCHANAEDSEDPGMPLAAQCALCHSDLDQEKPEEERAAALFEGSTFRAAHAGRQSEEILFSHQRHAALGLECTACHAQVAEDEGTLAQRGLELRLSMDACVACHAASSGPLLADCAACHAEIRAGVAPPSHRDDWTRYHGSYVRGRAPSRSDQCALCHQQSECTTCHQIELPANHNNYWRRRGHGLTASMDRDGCVTCHDSDSCQRCHEETRPVSHVGSWGAPKDRHCLECHEPLRATSCGVCHEGTPSHDQATPLPPDHSLGMDCRACHGHGQPLPHVDNGQPCTSCHQ